MRRLIIFDLDGTVCDSWPGMEYCYNCTFRAFGREDMTEEEFVGGFVGNLSDNLRRMLNIDGDDLQRAIDVFRDSYEKEGHSKSSPFPGVPDLMRRLHDEGNAVGVATMTYQPYAVDTIRELGIADAVDCIQGSDARIERKKDDMIRVCMKETGVSAVDTVMIGDGFNDMKAAEKTGVGFIAAAYGYGITVSNCEEYGIEFASSPGDLERAVRDHWARPSPIV